MAITTLKGHVSRALDFYDKDTSYFILGRTTPWTEADRTSNTPTSVVTVDDNHPPTPVKTDDITDIVGMKKVEAKFLVVPDESGTLSYMNKKWKIIPKEEALNEGARWVFITSTIKYTEFPVDVSYRQVGACTSVKLQESADPNNYVVLPTDIKDKGILEILDNRKPIYREADQVEILKLVVEF